MPLPGALVWSGLLILLSWVILIHLLKNKHLLQVFEDVNEAARYCDLLQGGGQGCEGVAEIEASSVRYRANFKSAPSKDVSWSFAYISCRCLTYAEKWGPLQFCSAKEGHPLYLRALSSIWGHVKGHLKTKRSWCECCVAAWRRIRKFAIKMKCIL